MLTNKTTIKYMAHKWDCQQQTGITREPNISEMSTTCIKHWL